MGQQINVSLEYVNIQLREWILAKMNTILKWIMIPWAVTFFVGSVVFIQMGGMTGEFQFHVPSFLAMTLSSMLMLLGVVAAKGFLLTSEVMRKKQAAWIRAEIERYRAMAEGESVEGCAPVTEPKQKEYCNWFADELQRVLETDLEGY